MSYLFLQLEKVLIVHCSFKIVHRKLSPPKISQNHHLRWNQLTYSYGWIEPAITLW